MYPLAVAFSTPDWSSSVVMPVIRNRRWPVWSPLRKVSVVDQSPVVVTDTGMAMKFAPVIRGSVGGVQPALTGAVVAVGLGVGLGVAPGCAPVVGAGAAGAGDEYTTGSFRVSSVIVTPEAAASASSPLMYSELSAPAGIERRSAA